MASIIQLYTDQNKRNVFVHVMVEGGIEIRRRISESLADLGVGSDYILEGTERIYHSPLEMKVLAKKFSEIVDPPNTGQRKDYGMNPLRDEYVYGFSFCFDPDAYDNLNQQIVQKLECTPLNI